jgi:iron complex outermembrane recepter protein
MNRSSSHRRWSTLALLVAAATVRAQAPGPSDLADLSVEELTQVEVTRYPPSARQIDRTAAAAYVLTQDTIRRSGATTIPEALRLVPGLQVAQVDASRWAISARGFNNRLSNKLLVLLDGRSLYTPAFGGVFWDAEDTSINDIERIEVTRGPGAAKWGANAVNGVVNIITKHAAQTDGTLAHMEAGLERPGSFSMRHGDASNPAAAWRVFGKQSHRAANVDINGNALHDEWEQTRIGARADFELSELDHLRTSFDAYRGYSGLDLLPLVSGTTTSEPHRDDLHGMAAAAAWTRTQESGGELKVFGNFEHSDRASVSLAERRDVFDLSFEHVLPQRGAHALYWGASAHYTRDRIPAGGVISIEEPTRGVGVYSLFGEHQLSLLEDRVVLITGAKVEAANDSETFLLPNLRAQYTTKSGSSIWGAVSQGARRPARMNAEMSKRFNLSASGVELPQTLVAPLMLEVQGDAAAQSERLTAYELGLRHQWAASLSSDVSVFYNRYEQLLSLEVMTPECRPSGVSVPLDPACIRTADEIVVPLGVRSSGHGNTWGGELQLTWAPLPQWRLVGSVTYLRKELERLITVAPPLQSLLASSTAIKPALSSIPVVSGGDPEHQLALQSFFSVGAQWDWDVYVRHIGSAADSRYGYQTLMGVPAYTELTMRVAWRPTLNLELALIGNNLLHESHREFVSEYADIVPADIERSLAFQLRWVF